VSFLDRLSALVSSVLPERARWAIAYRLNRWLPRQCWADWVFWAMRTPRDDPDWRSDVPYQPITAACRKDAESAGRCYCGTLGSDGTMLREGEFVCVTRMPGRERDRMCSRPAGHDGMHSCGGVEWAPIAGGDS
jgi:hypothetical protein